MPQIVIDEIVAKHKTGAARRELAEEDESKKNISCHETTRFCRPNYRNCPLGKCDLKIAFVCKHVLKKLLTYARNYL